MGDKTSIGWTDATWNPVTGCTKVSQGCKNCYAERVFPRAYGKDRKFTDVRCHLGRLDQPLRWKKPRRIFVNSMSDLFHEDVPAKFIDRVFAVMCAADQHIYQILTKRPQTMLEYMSAAWTPDGIDEVKTTMKYPSGCQRSNLTWPPEHVHLGVSVENQETANERIPILLQTPAAVRFISYEPALGPLNVFRWFDGPHQQTRGKRLDWIICGGESGPHARIMEIEWLRSIVEQCQAACVPIFVKQDSGKKAGQQGRIPNDLWIKEFPK